MIVYECDGCGRQERAWWYATLWNVPKTWVVYDTEDEKIVNATWAGARRRQFCTPECCKLWMKQRDYQIAEKEA